MTSPTAIARRRAIAASGSGGSDSADGQSAPVSAPASTGRLDRRAAATAGGRRTTSASAPSSTAARPSPSASWGRANRAPRSISSALK